MTWYMWRGKKLNKSTDLKIVKKILQKHGWTVIKHYKGILFGWFETGTEGTVWTLQENGEKDYDGLQTIEEGDFLRIYNGKGKVIFSNFITADLKAGWKEYPKNPGHGQPCALNRWVHWTQKGWKPDNWAMLFLKEDFGEKPLRAELIKPSRHRNEIRLLKFILSPKNKTPK